MDPDEAFRLLATRWRGYAKDGEHDHCQQAVYGECAQAVFALCAERAAQRARRAAEGKP